MGTDANSLLFRHEAMKEKRLQHETTWQLEAEFFRPVRQGFTGRVDAPVPDPNVFDATGFSAASNFAGGMFGSLVNPASQWFELGFTDASLNHRGEALAWLAEVSRIALKSFGPGISTFYGHAPEMIADTGVFGTGVFLSEEMQGRRGFYDACLPLTECYLEEDGYGQVDALSREFPMTARAIVGRFGSGGSLPADFAGIEREADLGRGEKHTIIHIVVPNDDYRAGAVGWRGKPYLSAYFLEENRKELRRGGYDEMPFMASRWSVPPGHIYGYGIGRQMLPDAATLSAMMRDLLIYSNRVADPTVLVGRDDELANLMVRPGKTIPNSIDDRGERMVDWLTPDGKGMQYVLEHANQIREQMKEAFLFATLHLVGRTGVNPLETMARDEQRMRMMAPNQARLQNEWLRPLIARRFRMLDRLGQFPEPPEGLDGADLTAVYTSPMAQAQFSSEAMSTERLAAAAGMLAQVKPEVLDRLNADEMLKTFQRGLGAPSMTLHDDETTAGIRQQREQAQAMAAQLQAGETGANIIGKVGQAAAAMRQDAA